MSQGTFSWLPELLDGAWMTPFSTVKSMKVPPVVICPSQDPSAAVYAAGGGDGGVGAVGGGKPHLAGAGAHRVDVGGHGKRQLDQDAQLLAGHLGRRQVHAGTDP